MPDIYSGTDGGLINVRNDGSTSTINIDARNDKIQLAFTIFHFSLWGILIESFLIKQTNTLGYRNPTKNLNVPLWLLPVYSIFVLGALHTYHIFCIFFNK